MAVRIGRAPARRWRRRQTRRETRFILYPDRPLRSAGAAPLERSVVHARRKSWRSVPPLATGEYRGSWGCKSESLRVRIFVRAGRGVRICTEGTRKGKARKTDVGRGAPWSPSNSESRTTREPRLASPSGASTSPDASDDYLQITRLSERVSLARNRRRPDSPRRRPFSTAVTAWLSISRADLRGGSAGAQRVLRRCGHRGEGMRMRVAGFSRLAERRSLGCAVENGIPTNFSEVTLKTFVLNLVGLAVLPNSVGRKSRRSPTLVSRPRSLLRRSNNPSIAGRENYKV